VETCSLTEPALVAALTELAAADKWAFRSWSTREYSHGLFQYPAMMVPQMQRELLEELQAANDATSLYDPFVGSGTTLAEGMLQGLDFLGADINPLAILLCRAKAGPYFISALEAAGDRVCATAAGDRTRRIELGWDGWEKWFRRDVAGALSKLRRAIRAERQQHSRRFLWVCLAETVRLTSNSRTSTVKLHVRPADEINSRAIDPLHTFRRVFDRNLERFDEQRAELCEAELLTPTGRFRGQVELHLHDISSGPAPTSMIDRCELLLTSPPYGDNVTTVPYGQAAFLPLQWIDLYDIDEDCDDRFLASTHAIDAMSLGAPLKGALEAVEPLRAASPALDGILTALCTEPRDRQQRVAAFWRDLDASLDHILASLAPGALMAWTVGNRRVGQRQIPMDGLVCELLGHRGCEVVTALERKIPDCRKRMASRNSVATTMDAEKVLVVRGPASA
jgi:hypothetical protein